MSWPTYDLIRITSGKLGKKNLSQMAAALMENGDYRVVETGDIIESGNPLHSIWGWAPIETKKRGPNASLVLLEGEMEAPAHLGMGSNITFHFDGSLAIRVKGGYLLASNEPFILTREEIAQLRWTDIYAIPGCAIENAVDSERERANLLDLAWNPQAGANA